MTDFLSPAVLTHLSDTELLTLYLSLPPGSREKSFLTTADAARLTGVSTRTIQLWVETGAVRALVIGRRYKVVLPSLRAHLERKMSRRDH